MFVGLVLLGPGLSVITNFWFFGLADCRIFFHFTSLNLYKHLVYMYLSDILKSSITLILFIFIYFQTTK